MKSRTRLFLCFFLILTILPIGCQQKQPASTNELTPTNSAVQSPTDAASGKDATPSLEATPSGQNPSEGATPGDASVTPTAPADPTKTPEVSSPPTPTLAEAKPTATPTNKPTATPTPKATATPTPKPQYAAGTILGNAPVFSKTDYFYNSALSVSITAEKKGTIYYTTDGTEPTKKSTKYTGAINIAAASGNTPRATVLRAKAFYDDGSESPTAVHTYFVGSGMTTRFSTLVFAISGDPADLTKGPSGILYGSNYTQRGPLSERPVYLEVISANGAQLISQYSGVRVYGGYSRQNSVKSLKLFARKSYASGIGKFKYNFFDNKAANGSFISSYDKLVLRSYGNDWQFAYVRDEMCQRLAVKAGYPIAENVVPALVYLNGEYYNFVWLHESYCDDFLKQKFGGTKKKGSFEVCEGSEQQKNANEDDPAELKASNEYNSLYKELCDKDLTDEETYQKLSQFIDVNNYLDYYAFNIYINNWDWPNNNYKVYRYYKGSGETYNAGTVFDGRWRFLLHDTDYSFGLYNQNETQAWYDNMAVIMDPSHARYSPLFTNLMKRQDCREYFVKKVLSLSSGALSSGSVRSMLTTMTGLQKKELSIYMTYLNQKYNEWTNPWSTDDAYNQIRNFAASRPNQMISIMARNLGMTEAEINGLK